MRDEPTPTVAERFVHQLALKRQEGMRHVIKPSLLVTTGLTPTELAAQTLVA